MGKWSEAIRQPIEEAQQNAGRWSGALRQTEQQRRQLSAEMSHEQREPSRETRATVELPELGAGGLLAESTAVDRAKIAAALTVTSDPNEMAQILTTLPYIKITQDEGGNLIANNINTGAKSVINKPGISPIDIAQGGAAMAAFTPAGRAASLATGGAAKVATGALGAGLTEAGIQAAQQAAGGEFDPSSVALSAGLGAGAELAGLGFKGLQQSRQAKRLRTEKSAIGEVKKEVSKAARTEAKTGVELFPGQKTLDPFALEEQSYVASLPAAARKARVKLQRQNKQVGKAVDDFLEEIAPARSVETAAANIRNIAEESITNAKLARSADTGPLFKAVWDQKKIVRVDDIVKGLDDQIKNYGPGKIQTLLKNVKTSVEGAAKPIEGSNLLRLHNLKREIYAKISSFEREAPLSGEIKGQLKQLYGDIVGKLKDQAPGYEGALSSYIQKTPGVEALTKGATGRLAKLTDTQLKSVTSIVFDQAETNPAILKQAKKLISDQNPDAWKALVRTEAQKRLKNIDTDITKLTPDNLPGVVHRALFGAGSKRRIFLESLDQEQKANALFLEDALQRAAKGRPGGSQTGIREVINEKVKGMGLALRRFLASPLQRTIATGEESAFNRNAEKMADALFDTKWSPRLSKIRKTKDIPASMKAMTQLLNDIEGAENGS